MLDSSYHTELMTVEEGVLFEALAYKVYMNRRYYFSLLCTLQNVIGIFDVIVELQKGNLRF